MEEPHIGSSEEFSYGLLIKALTGALYPNKFDILREYVQNSCDAIKDWKKDNEKRECGVQIKIDGSSIFIYDNATGMTLEKISQYRYLGFSQKRFGEYVGYRGIGSAAGIAVAEELLVITTPFGTPQKYILTIRAGEMLRKIDEESRVGQVSSVKDLMLKYSELRTDDEDADAHYTQVELRGIKQADADFKELLEQHKVMIYLASTVPVPFSPDFKNDKRDFGEEIDQRLHDHVPEYSTYTILINGEQVYKMYRAEWEFEAKKVSLKEPEYIEVLSPEGESIAYCWYCDNVKSGQIDEKIIHHENQVDISGLVFRLKGFAVGGREYVRDTIWKVNANFAYWLVGEIHVIDEKIEPTAERSEFVDNSAKIVLFEQCAQAIRAKLSKLNREKSATLTAIKRIDEAEDEVKNILHQASSGIEKELVITKQLKLKEIIEDTKERKKKVVKIADDVTASKADKVIDDAIKLFNQLSGESSPMPPERRSENGEKTPRKADVKQGKTIIVDITEELDFDESTKLLYHSIMQALRDFFAGEADKYERVVTKIHDQLRRDFGT